MKRLMLDTNIFGLLFADLDFHKLHHIIEEKKEVMKIYGLNLIRLELKGAPRRVIAGVNVQASLGGGFTKEKLWNDFLIVACASVRDINIVVSEDNATMLNKIARNSYQKVNGSLGLRLPEFIGYKKFKNELLRTSLTDPFIDSSNKFGVFLCSLNISPLIFHSWLKESLIYKSLVTNHGV